MTILITILLIIASTIALILILALFTKKHYNVNCEIIINAPLKKVYNYLKHIKNQDNFNKWVMVDPNMKKEFKGNDGAIGFIYAWNGNKKAGEGEQEIKNIEEDKFIETEIRFIRPMSGVAFSNIKTEIISVNQTKVSWSNKSKMHYPINILIVIIEKMLIKDMDESLKNLKNILEK